MTNTLTFATVRRQARMEGFKSWLNAGALAMYSGVCPVTPDTALTTQVMLALVTLPNPAGTVADGVLTGSLPEETIVLATGTATWCRFLDSVGSVVADGSVGVLDSGAVVEVASTYLVLGSPVSVLSLSLTEG